MAYRPPKYGIRTPPFMPYEPFLLGVGVVFNLLIVVRKKLPLEENTGFQACLWFPQKGSAATD